MIYAPSRFWLLPHLTSEHKRKIQRGWKHIPQKIPPPGAKGSPSVTEKLQQVFRRLVHPDARRFWATFTGHGYVEGVRHKDSSGSRVRGMRNPITPYHKNSSSN
jgi:hypothetical protein